jgi:hypothetical protein
MECENVTKIQEFHFMAQRRGFCEQSDEPSAPEKSLTNLIYLTINFWRNAYIF